MNEDDELDDYQPPRLCTCGCLESEHSAFGRCLFCLPENCGGFTYDAEGTLLLDVFTDDI